jgi:hypothetical protein
MTLAMTRPSKELREVVSHCHPAITGSVDLRDYNIEDFPDARRREGRRQVLERVEGFEPSSEAWKRPLYH